MSKIKAACSNYHGTRYSVLWLMKLRYWKFIKIIGFMRASWYLNIDKHKMSIITTESSSDSVLGLLAGDRKIRARAHTTPLLHINVAQQ